EQREVLAARALYAAVLHGVAADTLVSRQARRLGSDELQRGVALAGQREDGALGIQLSGDDHAEQPGHVLAPRLRPLPLSDPQPAIGRRRGVYLLEPRAHRRFGVR